MNKKHFGYDLETVPAPYHALGVIYAANGCCPDKPVVLTVNQTYNGLFNFSCQCACGGWCTSGKPTPHGAIAEYGRMTDQYIKELKGRNQLDVVEKIESFAIPFLFE